MASERRSCRSGITRACFAGNRFRRRPSAATLIRIAWHEGMTVADLLSAAPDVRPSRRRATGQAAFVTAIDDVANEGADGKNWTYEVNGQVPTAVLPCTSYTPGDRVLWTFGPRR